jgi:8-oxo-dGTP diphosphatase
VAPGDNTNTRIEYDPAAFPPFAVTVDLVILTIRPPKLQVLLLQRAEEPFAKWWALPGGFVGPAEDLIEAAQATLQQKTGVAVEVTHLEQLASFGRPDRDPRMRVVSVAWLALLANPPEPVAGTDALDTAWVDVDDLDPKTLAFDHRNILEAGVERARNRIEYTTLATQFLSDEFTIAELRSVYETLWGSPLDPANFHRKVHASEGFVVPTGRSVSHGQGRPAKTFSAGPAKFLEPPLHRP